MKIYGIIAYSSKDEKTLKAAIIYYAKLIGGLPCHLEFLMNKIGILCDENSARTDTDRNANILLSEDYACHQVIIEEDTNVIRFSAIVINNTLLILYHATVQSLHMLTYK